MSFKRSSNPVTSQQLGFYEGFEIICGALQMTPRVGVFFSFFRTKGEGLGKWISFYNHVSRSLLTLFTTSYKSFKVKYFRVRAPASYPELLVSKKGVPHFPLYWQSEVYGITGVCKDKLSPELQEDIDLLSKLYPMSCKDVIELEGNEQGLKDLLCKFIPFSYDRSFLSC